MGSMIRHCQNTNVSTTIMATVAKLPSNTPCLLRRNRQPTRKASAATTASSSFSLQRVDLELADAAPVDQLGHNVRVNECAGLQLVGARR